MGVIQNSALLVFIALIALASSPSILQALHATIPTNFYVSEVGSTAQTRARLNFSWGTLRPSERIVWHDCFTEHQCARLVVPLNYSDPDGEKAIIALTRIPSPLPADSPLHRGPILFNPGGPGASGVKFVAELGKEFSRVVGPQFDILGFDPRGIGHSLPRISFFKTAEERALWPETGALRVLNTSADGIAREWALAKVTNQLAGERQLEVLKHINTDQTARDMLRITQAHRKEKLQYWGFSYGSVLGVTFAAMFPDKVERMVIDGVMDAEDYYATLWSKNLLDTDKTMQTFFDACAAAGPDDCSFYAPTPEDISRNLTKLYNNIREKPMPVRTDISYGLVDYGRLRLTIFAALQRPFAKFSTLARGLADLSAGNGTHLFQMEEESPFHCSCDDDSRDVSLVRDAETAIICNDGAVVPDSLSDFQAYYEELTKISSWGEIWATVRGECIGWPDLPKTHYRGPFVGNSSFPLLIIGNTADPASPLSGAKKTAKGFPGSVVLTQDSPGHTSLAAPSICTQKYVREYFANGTLPDADTVCDVVGSLFSKPAFNPMDQTIFKDNLVPGSEQDILAAIKSLSTSPKLAYHL